MVGHLPFCVWSIVDIPDGDHLRGYPRPANLRIALFPAAESQMNFADRRSLGEPRGGRLSDHPREHQDPGFCPANLSSCSYDRSYLPVPHGIRVRARSHCWNPGQAPFGFKPGFMQRLYYRPFWHLQEVIEDVAILDHRRG